MSEHPMIHKDISKEKFDFVQKGQKLYDQKIQGKPITFLQDVWLRFRKNKVNVIATVILLTLIACSLTMPALSGKEYVKINEKLSFLPPRVPLLEHFGIWDGKERLEGIPVDYKIYDEETGLYYPLNFVKKAVDLDTLTNEIVLSNEKVEAVLHGQALLKLDHNSTSLTVESQDFYTISKANNGYIEVNVFNIASGSLDVQLKTDFTGVYKTIKTITEPGVYTMDVFELDKSLSNDVVSKIRLQYNSDILNADVAVTSVALYDDTSDDAIMYDEGYKLSSYMIVDGKGSYQRQNGELLVASFDYDRYAAAFDLTHEIAFSSEAYDRLLETWGDKAKKITNPENPEGWFFEEGFPIREVIKVNDAVVVNGESYASYEVLLDYKAYLGYEDIPYFLFGTTQAGRDVFSLVWVGLRTSLLLGFIVTVVNVSIGIVYGAISGFYGGKTDLMMQRFAEVLSSIPWLVVLAIMVVFFDPGIKTLLFTMIISGWIGTAGITRMQFYRYKGREYVLAAKTLGARDRRLIFRHILPNGIGTIITASILSIPGVIFTEAALSFLGFGIGHGQSFEILGMTFSGVSIGVLLSDGRNFLSTQPYLTAFPAVIVSVLMITFNMFGNALRDAFNPSLRGSE